MSLIYILLNITEFGSLCVDGNLSTQEAEKGEYTRLDYSLYRGKPVFQEKKRKNKKNSKSYVASINLGRNGSHDKFLTQLFLFKYK